MSDESKEIYVVPAKFRALENMHVLFWLIKDICWCIAFKPLGIAMIFPTLTVAVYIMWRNRHIMSELAHNIAITLWIIANSMWMVLEFVGIDDLYKNYCLIPFTLGLAVLLYYYFVYAPIQRKKAVAKPVVAEP